MSDLLDFAGGLLTHPIDTLTGKLQPKSPYNKPAYTSAPAPHAPAAASKNLADMVVPNAVKTAKGQTAMDAADELSR